MSGATVGSKPLGFEIMPASIAASQGRSCEAQRLPGSPQPGWFQPKKVLAAASMP